MIMDVITLAFFALIVFLTMRKGFAQSVLKFFKGVVSVILAVFFCSKVSNYLTEKTGIDEYISSKLSEHLSSKVQDSDLFQAIPSMFKSGATGFANSISSNVSGRLTDIFMLLISFLLIIIVIRFVLSFIARKVGEDEGFVGFVDKVLGLVLGALCGVVYTLIFLALLFPACALIAPGFSDTLASWFDGSYFAQDLYDNNIVTLIFRDFLS